MNFKRLLIFLLVLFGIFVITIFSLDFFIDKNEFHVVNGYSILEIYGDHNLMQKEENGYALIVPDVLNVYVKQNSIIAVSAVDGSLFINAEYKSRYFPKDHRYYYIVKQFGVQEISIVDFRKLIESYNLVWSVK